MPMLKGLPSAWNFSITGFSASALIGCTGLPSAPIGICGFIIAQTALETVMPLPLRSIEKGVTMCGLGAEADRGGERLAGEHVGAVEFAGDDAVEQHLPVRLRFERDVEAFVLEVAELLGDGERRHVGELDEAELELVLLGHQRLGPSGGHGREHQRREAEQKRERGDP